MVKKRLWAKRSPLLVFALLFFFSALVSFASPMQTVQKTDPAKGGSRMSLGILAGYGLFSSSHIGGSPAFGVSFSLGLSRNLAIELAGGFMRPNMENDPQAHYQGKLLTVPLQLSLLGRFPVGRKLTPYVLAGGSYFINRFTLDGTVVNEWNAVGMTLTEKMNNTPGFHFGAGLEYSLRRALSVGMDVRYFLVKAKGSWNIIDNASAVEANGTFSGANLNALVAAITLKYFLK